MNALALALKHDKTVMQAVKILDVTCKYLTIGV